MICLSAIKLLRLIISSGGNGDVGLSNCDDVLPIYVGDDRTDEDAFKVKSLQILL